MCPGHTLVLRTQCAPVPRAISEQRELVPALLCLSRVSTLAISPSEGKLGGFATRYDLCLPRGPPPFHNRHGRQVSTANNHTFWYEGDDEYTAAAAKVGGEVRRSTFLFRSRRAYICSPRDF